MNATSTPTEPKKTGSDSSCPGTPRPLRVVAHGQTDPGRTRDRNEDQFLIAVVTRALQVVQTSLPQEEVLYSRPQGHLLLVADGVGGHAAGEDASALAVNVVEEFVLDTLNWCLGLQGAEAEGGDNLLAEFRTALERADTRLYQEAKRRPELRGMGTTMTLGYCLNDELFVAHVGDSRCYLLRQGLLYRLTHDHTLVEEMVRRGILSAEEAAQHRYRHIITNVVGGGERGVKVEVHKLPLQAGDRLLLCSDGLTEMVAEEEILAALQRDDDLAAVCAGLIARANDNGGKDNITVVAARFEG